VTVLHLERREPARNWLRFYNIAVMPTLFGGWALVREWGSASPARCGKRGSSPKVPLSKRATDCASAKKGAAIGSLNHSLGVLY